MRRRTSPATARLPSTSTAAKISSASSSVEARFSRVRAVATLASSVSWSAVSRVRTASKSRRPRASGATPRASDPARFGQRARDEVVLPAARRHAHRGDLRGHRRADPVLVCRKRLVRGGLCAEPFAVGVEELRFDRDQVAADPRLLVHEGVLEFERGAVRGTGLIEQEGALVGEPDARHKGESDPDRRQDQEHADRQRQQLAHAERGEPGAQAPAPLAGALIAAVRRGGCRSGASPRHRRVGRRPAPRPHRAARPAGRRAARATAGPRAAARRGPHAGPPRRAVRARRRSVPRRSRRCRGGSPSGRAARSADGSHGPSPSPIAGPGPVTAQRRRRLAVDQQRRRVPGCRRVGRAGAPGRSRARTAS